MYYLKTHEKGKSVVTALCDDDILGNVFEDGELHLDVSERFYGGKLVTEEEAVKAMMASDILNISGKKIVSLALKNKIIKKGDVKQIARVPHAEAF